MKREYLISIITLALLGLWIPVVIDKLLEFRSFQAGITRQPLPNELANILVWTIPPLELIIVLLLIFTKKSRLWGMYLSFSLMTLFTGYIALALLGGFAKIPCGCGSVISGLTWRQHFWFNLFFTGLSGAGIYFTKKQRGSNKGTVATEGVSAKRQTI